MITDYYSLFKIEQFSSFNLTNEELFSLQEEYSNEPDLINIMSKMEAGIIMLGNPFFKNKYDRILWAKWWCVLSDPIWLLIVLFVNWFVRIRSFIIYSTI